MKPKKLHTNAPILAKIRKKTNSFEVPANYFDTFEDGVLAELHAEKLPFTSKKTFFEIPEDYLNTIEDNLITKIKSEAIQLKQTKVSENYFDEVEETIFKKLPKEAKNTSKVRKIATYAVGLAIAASFALFIFLNNNITEETTTFETIALSDIEQSINNGLIDVNQVTMTAAFPDLDIDTDEIMSNLTDDELLNYLNVQNFETHVYEN
ncbi:MAG: hypothetical protein KBE41_08605 [Lutibacter sp.]|nr:hypothetical protein [Lutibacter sp.]MBP9601549.1 hypothetical protein [Lutibacter sp.]